jgi:hypothetical protein
MNPIPRIIAISPETGKAITCSPWAKQMLGIKSKITTVSAIRVMIII